MPSARFATPSSLGASASAPAPTRAAASTPQASASSRPAESAASMPGTTSANSSSQLEQAYPIRRSRWSHKSPDQGDVNGYAAWRLLWPTSREHIWSYFISDKSNKLDNGINGFHTLDR